jgi:hypothetical protein
VFNAWNATPRAFLSRQRVIFPLRTMGVLTELRGKNFRCRVRKPGSQTFSPETISSAMYDKLLHLEFECDRAAREFLAAAAWGFNRESVREAVSRLTRGPKQSASAVAWLVEHAAKLPSTADAARRLHQLVHADAALRAYKSTLEVAPEVFHRQAATRLHCV